MCGKPSVQAAIYDASNASPKPENNENTKTKKSIHSHLKPTKIHAFPQKDS